MKIQIEMKKGIDFQENRVVLPLITQMRVKLIETLGLQDRDEIEVTRTPSLWGILTMALIP